MYLVFVKLLKGFLTEEYGSSSLCLLYDAIASGSHSKVDGTSETLDQFGTIKILLCSTAEIVGLQNGGEWFVT